MADFSTDLLHAEALVYAPRANGKLKLAAVEWVVRGQNSNPPGVSSPPSVLGMPMHILVPAVGFYLMHAWVWKPNPAGIMADWNPNVSCPERTKRSAGRPARPADRPSSGVESVPDPL